MKPFRLERLDKLVQNIRNLELNKLCFVVFRDTTVQKIVIDLNRVDQLFLEGIKSDGSSLPTYSKSTGAIAYNKVYSFEGYSSTKAQGEPFTLFDTGEFYKSFRLIQKQNGFIIYADDEKDGDTLQNMYGGQAKILGLTDESITKLTEEIKPYIFKEIRRQILS
jgi:hypothetical protein